MSLLYAPCHYAIFLNLFPLIFSLTTFGWLRSIVLNTTYFIIFCGNIFVLRLFYLTPLLQECGSGVTQGLGVLVTGTA
jgi:hypothetical protein